MTRIGERISWLEGERRQVGTWCDLLRRSNEAVILTDDDRFHWVPVDSLEQEIERLPETEYPTFQDAGIDEQK